jgi:alkylhydroperoxidase family enzyme
MTWLAEKVVGDSSLDEVYGLTPKVHERFRELERDVWSSGVDPALLELARLRIATLVACGAELAHRTPAAAEAGLTEEKIGALALWPTSPHFTARERLVLAFCESYVIDAHSVTDELCRRLNEQYSPRELSALTVAVAMFDAMARFRTALDA